MENQIIKKTLIAVPSTSVGGVANYYNSIQPFLKKNNVHYLPIGINKPSSLSIKSLMKSIFDLKIKLKSEMYSVYVANPSLDLKSIIRDIFLTFIAKNNGLKVVVFFRGWSIRNEKYLNNFPLFIRPLIKNSDRIIVLSSDFKKAVRRWGFKNKIDVESTTYNNKILKYLPDGKQKSDAINIVFLSRIIKEKGIYIAIKAFRIAKKQCNKKIKLIIVGDGPEINNVLKFISNDKSIELLGWLEGERKYKTLQKGNILLFPTYHSEGMPNSILEAMALGLPIITRSVGGVKDFFENKKNGFITSSKDPNIFARYLIELIDNEKLMKTISDHNMKLSQKLFSPENVSRRIIEILNNY